tara:strand:+ start:452 stop:1132 length:681 start_codon:yes stop_codon:yes gene_type:complete
MKTKFVLATLLMATFGVAQAFGLPKLGGGGGGGGGDVEGLVKQFNAENEVISALTANSLLFIQAALGDKTEVAAIAEKASSLSKATDPKEKQAIQGTVIKDAGAKVAELMASEKAKERMANLAPELQKKVSKSILNVAIAALKIPEMIDIGKKAIEGVGSNPMMISKIVPIKDGVQLFADVLPKMTDIVKTGFKMLQSVKIDPGSPAKDSKTEEIDASALISQLPS